MKCTILHETRGRMRVHTMQGAMSLQQADILEAYLNRVSGVTKATVYDRTGDAVICYVDIDSFKPFNELNGAIRENDEQLRGLIAIIVSTIEENYELIPKCPPPKPHRQSI